MTNLNLKNKSYRPIGFIILALAFTLSAVYLFLNWRVVNGQSPVSGNIFNFGGAIEDVQYCCDGIAISVGTPRPGWFKIGPGTIIYSWYNVFEAGPKTLGTYRPGGSCWTIDSMCELTLPLQGTIIQVGTSDL